MPFESVPAVESASQGLKCFMDVGSFLITHAQSPKLIEPSERPLYDLAKFFELLPNAFLCFDIGHARQIDPTMSEAWGILQRFRGKIKQLHVSEVNTQSQHDPISSESILAFQKVSHLLRNRRRN
jgi:hypothetical protein